MRFDGSCHCGQVRFELEATITRLSQCNCSMCSRKGALYIPVRDIEAVRIIAGASELSEYQFNTKTAIHYFCRHCGIHLFHRPRLDPTLWSVNARCLEGLDLNLLPVVQFDGKHWEASAQREGWIK